MMDFGLFWNWKAVVSQWLHMGFVGLCVVAAVGAYIYIPPYMSWIRTWVVGGLLAMGLWVLAYNMGYKARDEGVRDMVSRIQFEQVKAVAEEHRRQLTEAIKISERDKERADDAAKRLSERDTLISDLQTQLDNEHERERSAGSPSAGPIPKVSRSWSFGRKSGPVHGDGCKFRDDVIDDASARRLQQFIRAAKPVRGGNRGGKT